MMSHKRRIAPSTAASSIEWPYARKNSDLHGRPHGGTLRKQKQNCGNERERPKKFRGQIDYDVRTAFLNFNATKGQVAVVKQNVELANENLTRSKDREFLCH